MKKQVASALNRIRELCPLVHHITNSVTINDCANITLAIGASPVMADDENEVKEMVGLAKALVLNIGTLNSRTVHSMLIAGKRANELGIPVVLDPVGAGATNYRTMWAKRLFKELDISVIRGNASEIIAVSGAIGNTKGVDSASDTEAAVVCAKKLIEFKPCTVAVTGAIDIVMDDKSEIRLKNGTEMMKAVTGTGCMVSSLTGSFCGVGTQPFTAAVSALAVIGIAGELAKKSLEKDEAIGTFKARLFDYVHTMNERKIDFYMEAF